MTPHQQGQGTLRPPPHQGDHISGRADAPVTLVEFGDYECPHCFRAHPVVLAMQKLLRDKLRFVFRHFPLSEIHPHALHAAEAAESVHAQAGADAFWKMHHLIFEHQQDSPDALDDASLFRYAAAAGADPARVELDLGNDAHVERVRSDFMSGVRSGVNGTPTFFINGVRYEGDWTNVKGFALALEEAAHTSV